MVRHIESDAQRGDVLQALLTVAPLSYNLFVVGHLQLPLLEFHRVGAALDRGIHELLGDREIAVVVDADLGDDVTRLAGPDPARADVEDALRWRHDSLASLPCLPRGPSGVPPRLQAPHIT